MRSSPSFLGKGKKDQTVSCFIWNKSWSLYSETLKCGTCPRPELSPSWKRTDLSMFPKHSKSINTALRLQLISLARTHFARLSQAGFLFTMQSPAQMSPTQKGISFPFIQSRSHLLSAALLPKALFNCTRAFITLRKVSGLFLHRENNSF